MTFLGDHIPLNVPAFWRWFRNSVVRMHDGKPRPVYHGTRSPLDYVAFETGSIYDENGELIISGSNDPGAYIGPHFTVSPEVASKFAYGKAAKWDTQRYITNAFPGQEVHGRVIPVYLSIQRPFIVYGPEQNFWDYIFENGESNTIDEQLEMEGYFEEHDEIEDKASTYEEAFHNLSDESYDGGSSSREIAAEELGHSIRDQLIRQGYDGVIYSNDVEGGGQSLITFDPGQVKSVFNFGTWDPGDSNIMR